MRSDLMELMVKANSLGRPFTLLDKLYAEAKQRPSLGQ